MMAFILGLAVGVFAGMAVMALASSAKLGDRLEHRNQ